MGSLLAEVQAAMEPIETIFYSYAGIRDHTNVDVSLCKLVRRCKSQFSMLGQLYGVPQILRLPSRLNLAREE